MYFNYLVLNVFLIINYVLIIFSGCVAAVPGRGRHRVAVGVPGPRPVWEGDLASLSK